MHRTKVGDINNHCFRTSRVITEDEIDLVVMRIQGVVTDNIIVEIILPFPTEMHIVLQVFATEVKHA
jgi:hypothetical protein